MEGTSSSGRDEGSWPSGDDLSGVARLWGRSIGPSILVVLAATAVMLVALFPLYVWAANAALVLGLRGNDETTPRQFTQLLIAIAAPLAIVLVFLGATVVGAVAIVAARVEQGLPARPMGAFRAALRSSPRALVVLTVVLGSTFAAFVLTPFLVVAGVLALVVTPLARLLQRRAPRLPWPAARSMVVVAIPFGAAAALVVRWALVLPAVVVERLAIRAAFARSVELSRPSVRRIAVVALAFIVIPVAVLGVINARVLDGATAVVGPQLLSTSAGLVVLTLGVVAITYLFAQLVDPADLAFVEVPPPGRTRSTGVLLVLAVLAATAPVGVALARSTPAAAAGGATIVVTALGDAPDADPGDGVCDTGAGACSLRAALDEANQSSGQVIGFGVSGTIAVGSTLRIGSPLVIDGSGQQVTVSGGGAVGVFATSIEVPGGGSATIRSLTIANGYDGSTGGGAIFNAGASGGEGLVLDRVTVRDTATAAGAIFGGAVVNLSRLTIRNSTFSGNVADATTDGSDVANVGSGRATISQSTFAGSTGSSAVSSTGDDPLDITNSLVSGNGFACSGSFTGSGNVTVDGAEICPGRFGVAIESLGLTPQADNGGSTRTVRLLPTSPAVDAAGAAACAATDQRGATRPKGAGCDAGAYELDPATVTSLVVTPDTVRVGGSVTLEASVTAVGEPVVPTGRVELFDGPVSLGTPPLVGGSASLVVSSLDAGTHDLRGEYRPDSALASSTSPVRSVRVDRAPATVTLASTGSPTGGGEAVTFSMTVTGAGGTTPTGSVTLRDGTTALETKVLDGAGRAQVTTTALAGGPHVMVADYSGDARHDGATSPALAHEVVGGTAIVLRPPAAPTVYGNDAVFEVEVSPVAGGRTPTGLVTLTSGPTTVGFAPLDAQGEARIPVTVLPPGTSSVVATYEGDGFNGASTSSVVTHQVTAADTATRLTVRPSPSNVYGTALTVDVAVTAASTAAAPSGVVTIYDGSAVVNAVVLQPDGTLSSTLPVLPAGRHTLRAEFSGPAGFRPSSSPTVDHEVVAAGSAVALQATSVSSVTGELVGLTATVTSPDSPRTPVGAVTFRDGSTILGTVALDGSGTARLDTRGLGGGARQLTASFDGASDFAPSTSPALAHAVGPAPVRVTVQAAPTRTWFGSLVRIDVTVSAAAPGSGVPSGTLTIRDGSTVLGAPVLDATGAASLSVSTIAVGQRTITADYAGNGSFAAGTASTSQTIDPDTTTVTVLTSDPDLLYGRPVTLTAAVLGTGSVKPAGDVTFTIPGRTLGSAPLDASGRAQVTVTDLPVGSLPVEAAYAGDGSFTAGSGVLIQRVGSSPTSTSLVVTPPTPSVTDVVTLTATVAAPGAVLKPSGSVGFYDNDALIGTVPIDGSGRATFSQRFSRSSHELQARFIATSSWQASASGRVTIVPGQLGASLALGASPNPVVAGRTVTLVAAVPVAPGAAAPTGVIHVTDAAGTVGSAPLVDGVATLTAAAPRSPGPWVVSAWYPGDVNYEPVAPTSTTVTVEAVPTAVMVVSAPNPGYARSGPVTVRALVVGTDGTKPVDGSVRFTSDAPVLTSDTAAVDAEGFAEVTVHDVPAGSWALRAEYLPVSGSAYAGSSGATTHLSVRRSSLVKIAAEGLEAGRPTRVTALVSDPSGDGYVPSGTVLISAGDGATCTAAAPGGSCSLVLPATGPVALAASYGGDDRFLPDDDLLLATVTSSAPTLRVSSPTRTWTTGDPITIDWTLTAAATGTITVRSPFGVACTVPASASGSCAATIPFPERGAAFDFDVAYSGDARWAAARGSVSGTLRGCFPVPFTAQPAEGGTVTGPDGNCNGGAGFVDGTKVIAEAAPAEGYELTRWIETDSTTLGYAFVVGEGAHSATAVFALDCVAVATRAGQAPGVDPLGSAAGRVELAPAPDCGLPDAFDPVSGTTTSQYRRGSTVQATAVSSTPDRGQFKGWVVTEATGNTSYPTEETIGLTLTDDVDLAANFGARCYRPEVVADGDGTARIGSAPNCFDATGSGYLLQTDVTIDATPGAFRFVGPMRLANGAVLPGNAYRVLSDDPVTVRFDPCRKLTTGATGSGKGTVAVSVASTCPGNEPGYYAPGEIELEAVAAGGTSGAFGLPVEGDQFKRWDAGGAIPPFSRANPVRLDMSEDRDVKAVFTSPSRCAALTVKSGSPGWVGDLVVHQDPAFECRGASEYYQGEPFTLTSTTLKGSPLTQWQIKGLGDYESAAVSGKTTRAPDRTRHRQLQGSGTVDVAPMYGNVTATAYACTAINAEGAVLGADGTPIDGAAPPESFILYDSEPSCPGTGNGWLVGDEVGYFAGAQPVGWEFVRWQGAADGRGPEGSLVLDGAAPSLTLKALYRPICFTLTVTPEAHTYRGLDPDCPTADPSESKYIGGTTVALYATGGGEVWVGWQGDVERPENPTWVYVERDSQAHASWRNKTTNEQVKEFFTDFGDALAVGAKKLIGVAIMAANAMISNTVTMVLGAISLAATAIDAIAGALGAPSDGKFKEVMTGIQQTANLWSSPFSCGAEWAFSSGEGNSLDGKGGDWKDAIKDPKKMGENLKSYKTALAEAEDSAEGYMKTIKKFGVRANALKTVGTVGLTAVGIGTSLASDDQGWDDTAGEAWGSEGGRNFIACMEKSIPDYWGVPPLGFEDEG